jgi:hypothetical protein
MAITLECLLAICEGGEASAHEQGRQGGAPQDRQHSDHLCEIDHLCDIAVAA